MWGSEQVMEFDQYDMHWCWLNGTGRKMFHRLNSDVRSALGINYFLTTTPEPYKVYSLKYHRRM